MQGPERFSSFAEAVSALGRMTTLESAIDASLKDSKIPARDTRAFLKARTVEAATNSPLIQYFSDIFRQVGLGNLILTGTENFRMRFRTHDSPVVDLYSSIHNKTCYITVDAIARFVQQGMGIPCNVEEIACRSQNGERCEFEVAMQPLAVYQVVLDTTDRAILKSMIEGRFDRDALATEHKIVSDEVDYRAGVLEQYHLHKAGKPTDIGTTFDRYGQPPRDDEDFPPPWHRLAEISQAISSSDSFAAALTETSDSDVMVEVDEKEIVDVSERAKKAKSFAEMLSTYVDEE